MQRRVAVLALLAPLAPLASTSAAEQRLIDALIARVAAMNGVRFVRNGRDYAPADAAQFLREKLKARADGVDTADAFIERIATKSSTSGQPYVIREANGRERPVAEVLRAELAQLRAGR